MQELVDEKTIERIDDNYALLDPAKYNVSKDIVALHDLKALASVERRGLTSTLYGTKSLKIPSESFEKSSRDFIEKVLQTIYPGFKTLDLAVKTPDGEKLVGLKFSIVVNFDGTELVSSKEGEEENHTANAMKLLSKYGPMSLNEVAKELELSQIEAYQAIYPLLQTSVAKREADGSIRLLVKVAQT